MRLKHLQTKRTSQDEAATIEVHKDDQDLHMKDLNSIHCTPIAI